jgi:hypothetical protein
MMEVEEGHSTLTASHAAGALRLYFLLRSNQVLTVQCVSHRSVGVVQEEEETSTPRPSRALEERMLPKDHQIHRH